jgi:omega-6 fatty acid desaturase (delta-12 desaturase)
MGANECHNVGLSPITTLAVAIRVHGAPMSGSQRPSHPDPFRAPALRAPHGVGARELQPSQVRSLAWHRSKVALPLAQFTLVFGAYVTTWVAVFLVPAAAKLPMSVLNGISIGLLLIIAHDACHGAYFAPRWMNHVVGRLAFLPSLHPFSYWDLAHNRLHHGWTNFRPKDYAWAPFSKEEYDRLGVARRLVERIGRTFFGVGLYYGYSVWWRHMAFPSAEDRRRVRASVSQFDRLTILASLFAQVACGFELARHSGWPPSSAFLESLLLGWAVPFLVWNWLVGILTFCHHTHERVRWYDRREEWAFLKGALQGTVRVVFPRAIDLLFHNVMFHTAHHVDTRIPLYFLPQAQDELERVHEADVIRVRFTLRDVLATLRRCKLYDYRNHTWLDFDGVESVPRLVLSDADQGSDPCAAQA